MFSVSMSCGVLIGGVGALLKHARLPFLSLLVTIYVETFRNSPVLVQLFLVFYGLPMVTEIQLAPFAAATLTMSVNTGAFMTVIIGSALDAIPAGQWQAAAAFGLRYGQTMRHVIFPQAIRIIIPPTISLAVGQLQVTALVSLINVIDLTKAGKILNMRTLKPFIVWPVIAAVYLALSKPLSMLAARAEEKFRLKSTWK